MKNSCEVCLMPFKNDPGVRGSDRYCSLCYQNGHLNAEGATLKEFKAKSYAGMRERGMSALKAKLFTFMIGFAPYWKKRKEN